MQYVIFIFVLRAIINYMCNIISSLYMKARSIVVHNYIRVRKTVLNYISILQITIEHYYVKTKVFTNKNIDTVNTILVIIPLITSIVILSYIIIKLLMKLQTEKSYA